MYNKIILFAVLLSVFSICSNANAKSIVRYNYTDYNLYHDPESVINISAADLPANALVTSVDVKFRYETQTSFYLDVILTKDYEPIYYYLYDDKFFNEGTTWTIDGKEKITRFNGLKARGDWSLWLESRPSAYGSPSGTLDYWMISINYGFDHDDDGSVEGKDDDADGDGIPNWWEVIYGLDRYWAGDVNLHYDGDSLTNYTEYLYLKSWSFDDDYAMNPLETDTETDPDELWDNEEQSYGTKPNNPDTDEDGMPDGWEKWNYLDPLSPIGIYGADGHLDSDGVTNLQEYLMLRDHWLRMNPAKNDTDNDGMPDGWEYNWYNFGQAFGFYCPNPAVPDANSDCEGDGLTNYTEYYYGTMPIFEDSDGNGIADSQDPASWNTGSNSSNAPNIALSHASDNFGEVLLNTSSPIHTYTITNSGLAPLSISAVTLTGQAAGDFAVISIACNQALNPGSRCTIQVQFTPKSSGNKSAYLEISNNDPDTPQVNVALAGKGRFDMTPVFMLLLD